MPETLEYARPSQARLPGSELGSLSLALTGIWLACVGITLAAAVTGADVTIALGMLTVMAILVFMPVGFFAALLALTETDRCRTSAYVAASINGGVLMIFLAAVVRFYVS